MDINPNLNVVYAIRQLFFVLCLFIMYFEKTSYIIKKSKKKKEE